MNSLKNELSRLVPEHETMLILFSIYQKTHPVKNPADLLLLNPQFSESETAEAREIALRRSKGELLQHLLGTQFFLNHDYRVNSSTLVPRPETEVLAQAILQFAQSDFKSDRILCFAELGLGSGVLSIELLKSCSRASGVASELSAAAILLAEENLNAIVGSSWQSRFQIVSVADPLQGFEALLSRGPFDLVFSNPPYVSRADEIETQVILHEPKTALFPFNGDPNFFYANFIQYGNQLLKPNGAAFFEVPHERAEELLSLFIAADYTESHLISDLTQRPRVLAVKCKR